LVWDEKLRSLGLVTVRSIRTGRLIIDEPSEQVLRKLDRAAAIVATVQTSNGEVWEVRYAGLKRQAVRAKRAWAIDALRRAAAGHKLSSVTKMASCDSVE
jgi:hypothetical protein